MQCSTEQERRQEVARKRQGWLTHLGYMHWIYDLCADSAGLSFTARNGKGE